MLEINEESIEFMSFFLKKEKTGEGKLKQPKKKFGRILFDKQQFI